MHQHSGTKTHPAPLGSVTTNKAFKNGATILADVTACLSPDDLHAALSLYPAELRQVILSHVGLRTMRQVTPSAATGLVRVLQGGDRKRRASLINAISLPCLFGFQNCDDLSTDDCVKLLDRGTQAEVLPQAIMFATALRSVATLPENVVDLILVHIFLADVPLSPIALALLVGSAERMSPEAAEIVHEGWEELRATHSELPETPVSIHELQEAISSLPAEMIAAKTPSAASDPETPSGQGATNSMSEEENEADVPYSIESIKSDLNRLRETFAAAADAAERLRRALADAERPNDQDAELISQSIRGFDRLRASLEAAEGAPISATNCEDLQAALDRLVSADAERRKILALAKVEGPASLEPALQEIREAATQGSPVLGILADLIQLSNDSSAILQIDALQERFREQAPATWRPVATAAALGRLSVPAEPETTTTETNESGDDPTGEPASEGEPPDVGEEEHGEPATLEPSSIPPPSGTHTDDESTDGPAELDAFLTEHWGELDASAPSGEGTGRPTAQPSAAAAGGTASAHPEPSSEATAPQTTEAPEAQPSVAAAVASSADSGEASTGETSEPATDESTADEDGVARAEAAVLRAGRFGLAGWLRMAAGRPAAEVSARQCAAIAARMSEFSGRLASAFAASAAKVSMKALAGDAAGQLLAWAAALRTGLIHPTPEAAQLLSELTPALSQYPGLTACGRAFGKVAHDGIYLLPGLSGRMRNASQAENDQANAASAAAKLLEEGPAHTIKFALATDVWKFLLQDTSNGLGKLLHITARNEVSRLREVKQELDRLRSEDQIERLIDNTARQRSSGRSSARIHSGARTKLIEKIDKALDLVADWISAATEAESLRTDDSGMSWVVKPLNELRGIVAENRSRVDGELAQMERSADPVLAAAAVGAAMLIKETLALLDGHIPEGAEPPAAHVLNQDLLLSPSIRVDPNTLSPVEQPTLSDLLALATADDQGWREAFDRRAELGDHEGTRAILHVLTDRDPQLAAELRQRREKLVHSARHERDNRIEDITDRLAEWRRDGVLPEADATRLSARVDVLAGDDREDFGVIDDALRELEREAARIRQEEIDAESERLAELCATDANAAAARDRISAYIDAGDLTTAREFMAQVKEGKDLPEITEAIDHLDRFFPLFPQAFEEIAQRPGSHRNGEGAELLQRLKDALNSGNEVADPTLRQLLDRAGLSISAIPRSRRGVAGHAVRVWQTLSQGPKAAGNLRTAITAILQMIGLEGRQGDSREERNRLWITLDQVQTFGEPLLPAFGSRMSPSGDRLRLLLVWRPTGPQQVMDCLKDQPENQTVLVFYFGVLSADQRRQLAQASRRRPSPVAAVLDHVAISYLACLPDGNWTSTVRLLAPFTATNPYAPTGDVPEEMFKGRADQLRQVTSRTGACFVYGGRQLGKSALLRQAERNIRKTDADRKVISEVIQNIGRVAPVTALWPMLAGRLSEAEVLPRTAASLTDPQEICRAVKEWLAEDSARQLLILLDEADEFLNKDARDAGFANVVRLRNLMRETNDRVKVVFAGLHQTARFESLPNQPFAHLGAPIGIGPLDPQDAYTLLTEPMAALGFRFPTRLAARVIAEANNAPALIQLFADALLTRLRRVLTAHADLPYEITRDDVEAVWRDNKLARGFRDRFEWTLNLDKRYKVIAYTVAFHALDGAPDVPMTAARLRAECEEWWPQGFKDVSGDGFRGLLEECVNLGVLAAEGGCYRLRTPHILNLLGGAEEVENVLGQAESFELPDSFDAQSYRDDYKGRSERSPLTGAQVTRLLSPRNVLHVIAGSPALQIDRVATALEEAAARHKQAQVWRVGQGLTFEGAQQRAAQSSEHDIITVDLSGSSHMKATAMIRTAARAISMPARNTPAKGTLAVALIAPPEHAARWVTIGRRGEDGDLRDTTAEIIELQRFNKPAIRQWMHEVNLGFQDEAGQAALLRTTGGWPVLISRVVSALTENEADRDHALESCRKYLRDKPEDFVRKTGVLSGKAISSAWRTLVEQTEIADGPETLAELLALAGMEEDGHPLSEPSLQEEGFTSTTDLIEVLRILGVLVPDDEGRLRLEPVVADATRRMGWTG